MPDQTAASTAAPQPPRIPTGREIFDAIMLHIEPDLTSEGARHVKEKYAAETPEQREARKQRYELAFERYEQAYEGYMSTLHSQVMRFRRDSFSQVEMEDRARDQGVIQSLTQSMIRLA